jgi:hypothetical protein
MQRQAALRRKAFEDVHATGGRSPMKLSAGSAARGVLTGAKKARKVHKRITRHRVKPFKWHV